MKAFQVNSTGFGRQIFLAETIEDALEQFNRHVDHCDKLNGQETPSTDTVVVQVRQLGLVINHNP